MKSPISTIRIRMTGKLRSGSIRQRSGRVVARNVAHVSFGSPFTVMPQLPQIPILQDSGMTASRRSFLDVIQAVQDHPVLRARAPRTRRRSIQTASPAITRYL